MNRTGERGTVLVASIVILALLSLLGAGSLLNATIDTQLTSNQEVSEEAFYSAEAGLDVGVGRLLDYFKGNLSPLIPDGTWTTPATADGDPYDGTDFNGYHVEFKLSDALDPANTATEPTRYLYTTVESGQSFIHYAYTYRIDGRAIGAGGENEMTEILRVLETPLIQYFVFFDQDLSWHPGPSMISWGRIHTNGNLYFAPQGAVSFRDYDNPAAPTFVPDTITTHGYIYYGQYLQQDGSISSRASNTVSVRVDNLGTAPGSGPPGGDYEEINTDITPANKDAQEARFKDANDGFHVRVGVDRLPSVSYQELRPNGFYDEEAKAPRRSGVDGLRIIVSGGNLEVRLNGTLVTGLLMNYEVAPGIPASLAGWSAGAHTRADGSAAANTAASMIPGTIVYSPELFVQTDEGGGAYTAARGATANPSYPCILEANDGREGKPVDLTVIDMQRLQWWYLDYLDYQDDGALNASVAPGARQLLIYVSREGASPTTANVLQGVKLIGSRAGRVNTASSAWDQQDDTLLFRTTLVTPHILYLEGDFNAPGHAGMGGGITPLPGGFGCALLSDAVTLLSGNWQKGASARPTAFNAALFAGRHDYINDPASGEEAGVHNFTRFLETWGSTVDCYVTGCLVNLWFSAEATGPHGGGYYGPPRRNFGWDVGFLNENYWPPYVPSIFSVERSSWSGN